MNNKAKNSKVTVAGVVGLTAAGLAATIVLANHSAADTPDSAAGEHHKSAPVLDYTGPRTADAADAWLESGPPYTGPRTADAAAAWHESAPIHRGRFPTSVGSNTEDSVVVPQCLVTADGAEYWIRATGHLPCAS